MANAELAHYGVKGMRWGVRKDDSGGETQSPKRQKLTPKQKKIIVGAGIAVGVGVIVTGAILSKPHIINALENKRAKDFLISELKDVPKASEFVSKGHRLVDGMLADDIDIPPGVNFHRVASKLESNVNAAKYATYLDEDIVSYRANFNRGSLSDYRTTLNAVAGGKIAGETTMSEALNRLASTDSKVNGRLRAELISGFRKSPHYEHMRDVISKESMEEVTARWLTARSGGAWDTPISSDLFRDLSTRGYLGFTDNIDTSVFQSAKHAVVLINDTLLNTTGARMSSHDREAAVRLLRNFSK